MDRITYELWISVHQGRTPNLKIIAARIQAHIQAHTHMHAHACTHTHETNTHTRTHTCTFTHTHTITHTQTHTRADACTFTHTRTTIHTHTHTHTHTHLNAPQALADYVSSINPSQYQAIFKTQMDNACLGHMLRGLQYIVTVRMHLRQYL